MGRLLLVLVDPVLIHLLRSGLGPGVRLLLLLAGASLLQDGGLARGLRGGTGADLDREVLVNSGLLHWDLLHRTVVLRRQVQLILVLWLLPFGFRQDLQVQIVS